MLLHPFPRLKPGAKGSRLKPANQVTVVARFSGLVNCGPARSWAVILFLAAAWNLHWAARGHAQSRRGEPAKPTIGELRKTLQEKDAARANKETQDQIPWREAERAAFSEGAPMDRAAVELVNEGSALNLVWTIRRAGEKEKDTTRTVIRACVDPRSRERIYLEPGDYEIELRAGKVDSAEIYFPPRRVRLRRGSAFASSFDRRLESGAKRRIASLMKKSDPDSGGENPATEGAPK